MRTCTRCYLNEKCLGKTEQRIGGKTVTVAVYECPNCSKLEYVRNEP